VRFQLRAEIFKEVPAALELWLWYDGDFTLKCIVCMDEALPLTPLAPQDDDDARWSCREPALSNELPTTAPFQGGGLSGGLSVGGPLLSLCASGKFWVLCSIFRRISSEQLPNPDGRKLLIKKE
jgi:hypothetical protein